MPASVTVIVVSYNQAALLKRALEAIYETNYPLLQVIVVDNASADSCVQTALSFSAAKVVRNSENLGFAEGCNIGLREATGRYIALVNNDVIIARDWISRLVSFLEAHPEAAGAGSAVFDWDDENPLGRHENSFNTYPLINRLTAKTSMAENPGREVTSVAGLSGAALMIRRSSIDDVGEPFFEPLFFTYYEETDFFARSIRLGWKLYYVAGASAWHRGRSSGTPYHYDFYMERNRFLFAYRNFSTFALFTTILSIFPRAVGTLVEDASRRAFGAGRLPWVSPTAGPHRVRARWDAWSWVWSNRALLRSHRAKTIHSGVS